MVNYVITLKDTFKLDMNIADKIAAANIPGVKIVSPSVDWATTVEATLASFSALRKSLGSENFQYHRLSTPKRPQVRRAVSKLQNS